MESVVEEETVLSRWLPVLLRTVIYLIVAALLVAFIVKTLGRFT